MIILVYGDNQYLCQQKINLMRQQFKQKFDSSGMNLVEFEGKVALGEAAQAIQSPPFISQKRMVIIRNLISGLKKDEATAWAENLIKTPESTIVILWESESEAKISKKELFKQLREVKDVHHYAHEELTGAGLSAWAQNQAKQLKLLIDRQLLEEVVAMVGNDLWQLTHEFSKLAAYAQGQKVTKEMVAQLVSANFEDKIFAFVDAVSQQRGREALRLLNEERLAGISDHQLFIMLARQVRLLLGACSALQMNPKISKQEIASVLKVHPFVAQKILFQAKSLRLATLEHWHKMLLDFDKQIKRGGISPDLAVDRLVSEMLMS